MATANPTVKAVLNHLFQNGGGISKVIEEWVSEDGKQWYRVWSSGFIEQGGNDYGTVFAARRNIVFIKPFTKTVVSLLFGSAGEPNNTTFEGGVVMNGGNSLTLTGFTYSGVSGENHVNNSTSWYACGY